MFPTNQKCKKIIDCLLIRKATNITYLGDTWIDTICMFRLNRDSELSLDVNVRVNDRSIETSAHKRRYDDGWLVNTCISLW